MKQVILFLAVIMLLKPMWPLAEYVLNYDYIVENLCENKKKPLLNCNGKCFLAKQLAKQSEQKDKKPFGNAFDTLKLPIIDWFDIQGVTCPIFDLVIDNHKVHYELKSELFSSKLEQPPELI